ncbi:MULTISPECIES: hypothetical protein [Flavobacterium]|uniref:Peptide zinc metalloprotease protein n=1 Tax=Flavobacterium hankyongi TaxID=1176532 RepID=A0ABP8ZIT6_9FLAO|nr:hypothetical protein [Flavobacterium sp. N1846]
METTIDLSRVLRINDNCSWKKFDEKNHIICIDDEIKSKLYLTNEVIEILKLVNGKNSIEDIKNIYNENSSYKLSNQTILRIFQEKLFGYGIFDGDDVSRIETKNKYIWFKITIFNKNIVKRVSKLFTPAFDKTFFYPILFLSTLITISPFFYVSFSKVYHAVDGDLFVNFIIINLLTLIFHEFGHSAACQKYGGEGGSIGFGFYILSPVFFSDVTDAWRLHRKERLIVDLGGVYMQLIITAFFSILFFVYHDIRIVSLISLILIGVVFNLNPFLRYDGYWALSDLMNITNLRERSSRITGKFYGWIVGINKNFNPSKRDVMLIVYGNISILFILYILFYMVIKQHNSIIYFPKNLYYFVCGILINQPTEFNWYKKNIVALFPFAVFYAIIIISFYKNFKDHFNKRYGKI